jgi:hypothetical protein
MCEIETLAFMIDDRNCSVCRVNGEGEVLCYSLCENLLVDVGTIAASSNLQAAMLSGDLNAGVVMLTLSLLPDL